MLKLCVSLRAQRKAPVSAASIDGKPASLLFFEGATRVHGLFEHLLFEASSSSEHTDVPLLMAPVPFLGASLQQLQAQVRVLMQQWFLSGKPKPTHVFYSGDASQVLVLRSIRILKEVIGSRLMCCTSGPDYSESK